MVKYYPLDKIVKEAHGPYRMSSDYFFVIKKIGTNSTAGCKLKVAGTDTGEIIQQVAPNYPTSSNLSPLLDLGDLYYVLPPDKTYEVVGGGSDLMRIVGLIGELASGETIPTNVAGRFNKQGNHYIRYDRGSKTYDADYTWNDGEEITVYELTPATSEKFIFNGIVEVETGVSGLSPGDVGVIFYLDGKPIDILTDTPADKGIDAKFAPRPPVYDGVRSAFSLKDNPIEVKGDHNFKVNLLNHSGGSLTVDSTVDQYVDMLAEYAFTG